MAEANTTNSDKEQVKKDDKITTEVLNMLDIPWVLERVVKFFGSLGCG